MKGVRIVRMAFPLVPEPNIKAKTLDIIRNKFRMACFKHEVDPGTLPFTRSGEISGPSERVNGGPTTSDFPYKTYSV